MIPINPLIEAFFTNRTYSHITQLLFDKHKIDVDDEKLMIYHSLQSETLKEMDKDTRLRVLLILRDAVQGNIVSKGARSLKDYEEVLIRSKQSSQTLADSNDYNQGHDEATTDFYNPVNGTNHERTTCAVGHIYGHTIRE